MQEKDFVTYEYKTVSVKSTDSTRAMDIYESFGWEVTSSTTSLPGQVNLSLRRDRKLRHRQELNKLERQAEGTLDTLQGLERSKTMGASIFAYIFGIIAALVFGGGMCLCMLMEGSTVALVVGILLGILGIFLCAVNYLIYQKMAAKKTKQVLPVIDETEEKLAGILERGNDLLSAEVI